MQFYSTTKVKAVILQERIGMVLVGHWARRWIYQGVSDVWPVRRQTSGYLPTRKTLPLPPGRYSFPMPLRELKAA